MTRAPAKSVAIGLMMWCLTAGISAVQACSVPVFRYALERWPADIYDLYVFHSGPLDAEAAELLLQLKQGSIAELPFSTYAVHTVDLETEEGADRRIRETAMALWETREAEPPWMILRYPHTTRNPSDVWSGPFNEADVRTIVDSPLRQEIAKRIVEGESAVWVFLECGNSEQDDAAFQTLESELDRLEQTMEIPEIDEVDKTLIADLDSEELKIGFSLLRLSREDPAEAALVQMLLRSEPDLETDYGSMPMAFPVFGRGRALYALVGGGITPENIREACTFMGGACSCEVKELNPGTDLLIVADWESGLDDYHTVNSDMAAIFSAPSAAVGSGTVVTSKAASGGWVFSIVLVTGCIILVNLLLLVALMKRAR